MHTQRWTRAVVGAVFDAADESARRAPKKTAMPDPEEEHADVAALQNALDAIRLKSWQLSLRSAAFMRTSAELYDANALSEVVSWIGTFYTFGCLTLIDAETSAPR